jgi:hypothetical protein
MVKKYTGKGFKTDLVKEIETTGTDFGNTYISAELQIKEKFFKEFQRSWDKSQEGFLSGATDAFRKTWDWLGEEGKLTDEHAGFFYSVSEEFFKTAVYDAKRKQRMEPVDAMKEAQGALFDYNKVSPFNDMLRNTPIVGAAFPTFFMKLIPSIVERLATRPWSVLKYLILFKAIESATMYMYGVDAEDMERENMALEWYNRNPAFDMPESMKGLPISGVIPIRTVILPKRNKEGFYHWRFSRMNPMYGVMEAIKSIVPFINNPAFNAAAGAKTGVDPFTKKTLSYEYERRLPQTMLARAKYVGRAMAPVPSFIFPGMSKLYQARPGGPERDIVPQGNFWLTAMDVLGGFKVYPNQTERQLRRAGQIEKSIAQKVQKDIFNLKYNPKYLKAKTPTVAVSPRDMGTEPSVEDLINAYTGAGGIGADDSIFNEAGKKEQKYLQGVYDYHMKLAQMYMDAANATAESYNAGNLTVQP